MEDDDVYIVQVAQRIGDKQQVFIVWIVSSHRDFSDVRIGVFAQVRARDCDRYEEHPTKPSNSCNVGSAVAASGG